MDAYRSRILRFNDKAVAISLTAWEQEQVRARLSLAEGSNAELDAVLDALALAHAFDDLMQNRPERFDFPTVYSLVQPAEQLVSQLSIFVNEAVKAGSLSRSKQIDQTRHRLRSAIRTVHTHSLAKKSPAEIQQPAGTGTTSKQLEEAMRAAAAAPPVVPSPRKKVGPAILPLVARTIGAEESRKPAVVLGVLLIGVVFIGTVLALRRPSTARTSATAEMASEFRPFPTAPFRDILPVVEAARTRRALQIMVDGSWLQQSESDREQSLRALGSRLVELKVPNAEVVNRTGEVLARCRGRDCRIVSPSG